MSLRNVQIKKVYFSNDGSDLVNDFYVPALKYAHSYDRISGYFSPNVLSLAARGFAELILNDGKVRLLTSVELDDETMRAVKNDSSMLDGILSKELDVIVNDLEKQYLNSFSTLLASGNIEMKVVCVPTGGILHEKIGIIKDFDGNIISFSGSNNETLSGWTRNVESFKVFCSWNENDAEYIAADEKNFEMLWNNENLDVLVLPVGEAIKQSIIKKYKKGGPDGGGQQGTKPGDPSFLRQYQIDAIKSWQDNGYTGLFEMATGTGKTFTGLYAVKELIEETDCNFITIVVPLRHLISQWLEDIEKVFPDADIVVVSGDNPDWRQRLPQLARAYNKKFTDRLTIVVSTYSSFSTDDFRNILTAYPNDYCLLADEVHNARTEKILQNINIYKYRLGLSATPKNEFSDNDDPNSKVNMMISLFGGIVFKYTLDQAIAAGYLVKFDYHPIILDLNDEEMDEYSRLSQQISYLLNSGNESRDIYERLTRLTSKRASIIKKAESKTFALPNLLNEIKSRGQHRYMLVYCDDMEQITQAQEKLDTLHISSTKITFAESLDERWKHLQAFSNNTVDCLVARKCLDEGVNIPATQTAILIASNTDQREYIQRLGRILRTYQGKEKSSIYDLVIMPPKGSLNEPSGRYDKIVINELRRMNYFARNAINSDAINNAIDNLCTLYSIDKNNLIGASNDQD